MTRWWRMLYNNSGLCSKKNGLINHKLWINKWQIIWSYPNYWWNMNWLSPRAFLWYQHGDLEKLNWKCFKYGHLRSSLVSTRLAKITKRFISRWEAWRWIFRILKTELQTHASKETIYNIWNILYLVNCMTWYTYLDDIFARVARQLVWRYLSFTLDKLYWIVLTITKIIRLPSVIFSFWGLD